MNQLLDSNIQFFEKFDHKLASSLRNAANKVELLEQESSDLSKDFDLEYDNKLVAQNILSSSANALKVQLEKPKRILIQRLMSSESPTTLSSKDIFASIINSDKVELVQHLKSLYPDTDSNDRINQSLDLVPPNLLLIGSLSLVTLNSLLESCPNIDSILLVETSINQLVASMSLVNLKDLVNVFKSNNIKFNLIYDPCLASDSASLAAILRHYANLNPLALHSLAIFRSPVYESSYELIYSWIQSPDGFGELVKGYLGNETDEINQSLHTVASALSCSGSQVLLGASLNEHHHAAILTASGPSLDDYLGILKSYQDKIPIICAGSSFGSVLKAGIVPKAVVLLEMSASVYYDLLDLIADGFDLSNYYAFVSATVDPRIHNLFKGTIVFHRPLSSSSCLFETSSSSVLPQAGPQAVNAALETLVHLGYRKLYLFGCDFGGPNSSVKRSKNAMGKSSRKFDLPVMGGYGRTIMTSNELSITRQLFENIANVFNVELNVFGEGSKIDGANHIDKADELSAMEKYSQAEIDFVHSFFHTKDKRAVLLAEVQSLASEVRGFVDDLESRIVLLCDNQNLVDLKALVSELLVWSDESLPREKRIFQRIIRYPLFFIGQSLVDFEYIAGSDVQASKHWINIKHDLILLAKLLRHWCNCLDRLSVTSSVEVWSPDWLRRRVLDD